MSGDLTRFGGGLAARGAERGLARIAQGNSLSIARIDGEAQVQEAVVLGVATVGATAMRQVAMVSQLEVQLGQLVPAAVSRLQAIGDITGLAMAEVVSDTARRLNRAR